MKHFKIILICLLLFSLSACSELNDDHGEHITLDASKENIKPYFSFEYDKINDEKVVYFEGNITNLTEKDLKPFILELYITFDDGKEFLAMSKPIETLEASKVLQLKEDITNVYNTNGYDIENRKSFRLEIVNPQ